MELHALQIPIVYMELKRALHTFIVPQIYAHVDQVSHGIAFL